MEKAWAEYVSWMGALYVVQGRKESYAIPKEEEESLSGISQ